MKITPDTNVLIRAVVATAAEDAAQTEAARTLLRKAELVAVPTAALCEFVWVLRRAYGYPTLEIAAAIRTLCASNAVVVDRQSTEAGLAMLTAGGDFAGGVIEHEGAILGAEVFCSFDRKAVKLLSKAGRTARVLTTVRDDFP